MIVDPKTKPVRYITALDTVDSLYPSDVQSTHETLDGARAYADTRKRAIRIYECRCVDVITAESRRLKP